MDKPVSADVATNGVNKERAKKVVLVGFSEVDANHIKQELWKTSGSFEVKAFVQGMLANTQISATKDGIDLAVLSHGTSNKDMPLLTIAQKEIDLIYVDGEAGVAPEKAVAHIEHKKPIGDVVKAIAEHFGAQAKGADILPS